ncbi:type II secretion system protein N [Sphingomonas qilianensis]|uniref:Type II secretion system protein N n=1 Tax=Sphingomonas qilianensis TaxID=1736690 RepID=A0ABU9XPZ3_9SPHN
MRRIRLTTGPGLLFAAAFVMALLAFLPMRLVLGWIGVGEQGLTARAVEGSVWWGSLSEARFGDLAVGDLRAQLSPVQLLVGRARVTLDGREDVRPLHGAIGISRHSIGLDDMTASLSAGTVFAPVPVTGIDLDDVSVRFQDGNCARAEGRVRATLSGDIGGIALSQGMSGTAKCDSGALLLPLASQSGTEAATIRLWQTGRFRAEISVQPSDPAAGAKLVLSGFRPTAAGYTLAVEGTF